MDTSAARTKVKRRLDIDDSVTDFDTRIDEFVLTGVYRLYPIVQQEVAAATASVSVDDYGEASVALTAFGATVTSVRRVEAYAGGSWFPATNTYHHGSTLYVRDLSSDVTTLKVYPLQPYALGADLPSYLWQPVIWFALSEFYDFLAGNKRYYNLYNQSGARAVDNMRDESDFFEDKANAYLNDRAQIYGMA